MQPSIDLSLSTYSSRRTDTTMSSVYHHLTPTNAPGTKSRTEREESLHSKHASVSSVTPSLPPSYANTDRQPAASNHKMILEKFPEAPATKETIPLSSPSTLSSRAPSPFLSPALTSILLPSFPTTASSLENIQILSATVIRRTDSSSIEKERSSSLRNLAGGLGNGSSPSSKRPVWISQQMILTSFKIGGNTPVGSPNPEAAHVITSESETDAAKTTAHLHLFSIPTTTPRSSLKSSTSPIKPSPPQPQVELERMMLKADSTAGFWEETNGERKFVMRIGFGYGKGEEREGEGVEWIVEMRNAWVFNFFVGCHVTDEMSREQLREWIQQIKSIAVVIRYVMVVATNVVFVCELNDGIVRRRKVTATPFGKHFPLVQPEVTTSHSLSTCSVSPLPTPSRADPRPTKAVIPVHQSGTRFLPLSAALLERRACPRLLHRPVPLLALSKRTSRKLPRRNPPCFSLKRSVVDLIVWISGCTPLLPVAPTCDKLRKLPCHPPDSTNLSLPSFRHQQSRRLAFRSLLSLLRKRRKRKC